MSKRYKIGKLKSIFFRKIIEFILIIILIVIPITFIYSFFEISQAVYELYLDSPALSRIISISSYWQFLFLSIAFGALSFVMFSVVGVVFHLWYSEQEAKEQEYMFWLDYYQIQVKCFAETTTIKRCNNAFYSIFLFSVSNSSLWQRLTELELEEKLKFAKYIHKRKMWIYLRSTVFLMFILTLILITPEFRYIALLTFILYLKYFATTVLNDLYDLEFIHVFLRNYGRNEEN